MIIDITVFSTTAHVNKILLYESFCGCSFIFYFSVNDSDMLVMWRVKKQLNMGQDFEKWINAFPVAVIEKWSHGSSVRIWIRLGGSLFPVAHHLATHSYTCAYTHTRVGGPARAPPHTDTYINIYFSSLLWSNETHQPSYEIIGLMWGIMSACVAFFEHLNLI